MVKTTYTGKYRLSVQTKVIKRWFKTIESTTIVLEVQKRDYGYNEHFDSMGGPALRTDVDKTYWVNATLEDIQDLKLVELLELKKAEVYL